MRYTCAALAANEGTKVFAWMLPKLGNMMRLCRLWSSPAMSGCQSALAHRKGRRITFDCQNSFADEGAHGLLLVLRAHEAVPSGLHDVVEGFGVVDEEALLLSTVLAVVRGRRMHRATIKAGNGVG